MSTTNLEFMPLILITNEHLGKIHLLVLLPRHTLLSLHEFSNWCPYQSEALSYGR